jgi:hypothetical protein
MYETNYLIITVFTTRTIRILYLNSEYAFGQDKNETSDMDGSYLITTAEIDEGLENDISST